MTCKHKQKYTEKVEGDPNNVVLTRIGMKLIPRLDSLRTYCADCGVLLNDVELGDYTQNNKTTG